jgi:hypothetical protein
MLANLSVMVYTGLKFFPLCHSVEGAPVADGVCSNGQIGNTTGQIRSWIGRKHAQLIEKVQRAS